MKTGFTAIDNMISLNRIEILEGEAVTLRVYKARRNTPNSYWIQTPNVTTLSESVVDGATWYTVTLENRVYAWLLDMQDHSMWADCGDRPFLTPRVMVHEKLYSLMMLRWM
jgi:hypothetical protein